MRSMLLHLTLAWMAFGANPHALTNSTFTVVVHPSNPAKTLRFPELQAFFAGATQRWPSGSKVILVERDFESTPYQFLTQCLLKMSVSEYRRLLEGMEYRGESPVTLKVLHSDASACKFVFNVPGSIALIETNSLASPECGSVQVLRIDGKLPGEEGYRLR